jgi:hypothetical protein
LGFVVFFRKFRPKLFYKIDSRKIVDDGAGSTPRVEYFDSAGVDVTPMPLYIPEPSVVSAVEKNKMK